MKLRKLLKESEEAQKLTREQKRAIIDSVSKFNEYGKSVYRESDIKELVNTLKEMSANASALAVNEAGDWFDGISVKRDMKEVNSAVDTFSKTANEIAQLQQRLESVFEDIGHKLGKYYEIAEAVDHIDDKEADTKFDDLKDKDLDNDGDEGDDADKYLHKKLGTTAKKTESISLSKLTKEAAPRMRKDPYVEKLRELRTQIERMENQMRSADSSRFSHLKRSFSKAHKAVAELTNDVNRKGATIPN